MKKSIEDYEKKKFILELIASRDCEKLKRIFSNKELNIHSVNFRVKDTKSIERKIVKKSYGSLNEITDMIGFRVIGYFRNEIDYACKLIEEGFDVDWDNSGSRSPVTIDSFGYHSMHYVVNLEFDDSLGEVFKIKAEIQVRTILQHAWAEIEHGLLYKEPEKLPENIKRSFFRSSAMLEHIDLDFVSLRNQINDFKKKVPPHFNKIWEKTTVTNASLESYILKSDLVAYIDQKISEVNNGYLHYSEDTIDKLAIKLRENEIYDILTLDNLLNLHSSEVINLYKNVDENYLKYRATFPEKHGNLSMPKGSSITYLYFYLTGNRSL